ncbi:SDR family oxidoreductase [Corynebacterium heidelbergense]|uniref:Short-chain dehydrogenase n=1 Tax=Corynebacterium heidelbergense TaxID=2055947 RepID=A0A364VCB0_9CORY|nr:SDR family oxidoreductase [Corynebacterium heidelbergense]RAV34289.1 short-chain dehydrogenase [Corynebacterium heidelbergense]WCZ35986.1 3-alpha-(or 20-beta)-hydroxysteroid dehydrogenase [Corynebacterium heidelbergense]
MDRIFISGAARGIGRATAEILAAQGNIVGAYDVKGDFSWAAAHGDRIISGTVDVTKPDSWEAALADFAERAGGIDVLINNAGILYAGAFIDAGSYDKDAATTSVNVNGVLFGARAAYPYLRRSPRGRLVNLSSAAAIVGTPEMATYSASKFAVLGLTEALNLEWEQEGIEVRCVLPLYAQTQMLDGISTTGTRRLGVRLQPEDVAAEVVRAATDRRRTPVKVHFPAGWQAKLLHAGAHFSPPWLTRFVNAKLTTSRKVRL